MFVMGVVLSLSYPAFTKLLTSSKVENASNEAHLDKINGQELIRLDLEHAFYGIAKNESTSPLIWPGTTATPTLTINSTINNTNQASIGWLLYNCPDSTSSLAVSLITDTDKRLDKSNTCVTLLDHNRKFAALTRTTKDCPAKGVYTAFPVSNSSDPTCEEQRFTSVSYKLSATNTLKMCAKGTRNLLRAVGAGAGVPIFNCVADFTVTFDLDIDGNGTVDSTVNKPPTNNTAGILDQVKNINMYVLMQASKKNKNLNSNETLNIDVTLSKASVKEDTAKYRWKVVRISGKPMSW